ncbi:MAG: 16S rRNA (cytidine(1402)-2'-O)-methyltransferase [Chloroflexi bacterium]|nr:16S rRNA (cytidine(1402)-2'-O)-methyltransferase [Chloroflexota bacterium]
MLYVVTTPIGNLEDLSARALRVLGEVDLVAAEDTRATRALLTRHGLATPLTSYFEHNKLAKLDSILERATIGDVALVSEAGTPGISDPGYELIAAAIDRGIRVVPVPGPVALVTALAVSGLPTDQFVYLGFLPRKSGDRRRRLESIARQPRTIVAYEAPHRLLDCLDDVAAVLGDRRVAIARELTKLYEEVRRGTVSEVRAHFAATPPRGEITLVVAGAPEEAAPPDDLVDRILAELAAAGIDDKNVPGALARATGLPRRDLYRRWTELRSTDS